jgi:hypothetical protein
MSLRFRSSPWLTSGGAIALVAALSTLVLAGAGAAGQNHHTRLPKVFRSTLTPAERAHLSRDVNQRVIVLLRNQYSNQARASAARRVSIALEQAPITSELSQVHARRIHAYKFIDAISATMSKAEAMRLRSDPAVRAVVPDTVVQAPQSTPQLVAAPSKGANAARQRVQTMSSGTEGSGTSGDACPSNPAQPILEPEALQSMNVDFGPGGPPAAHSLANGSGVKVAVFPDGLDPNIPDFKRNGGTGPSAIFDYQDFSGEGVNGVTGGEEAFGDASSIISQGNQTFDLSGEVNPAHPLPPGCNIKIEGVAPGASLAVMKVFGDTNFAFNSEILQGIDYAINTDHVDILSESFGGNPVPSPGTDPIAVADQDAVNAGITVVVSSGDAGVTNTIGTPAVDPGVISAGATTDYRLYQQTTSYGIQFGSGWLSDQISGLSSSGVTEANRTIDVLAPGEAGWSDCSTNTSTFTECSDQYHGPSPQPIVAFGGTSESAPLTSGTAALVIQAYRDTHSGATPSPALVKQILMSTSRDVDSRAADQGAGLIDAYRAVQAARSFGNATKTGNALLYSPSAINVVDTPNQHSTTNVTVTNEGASPQTVSPSVRALGDPTTIASGTLQLNQATDPTFIYQTGATVGDVHQVTFTVPAGTDRLHAAIAWHQPASAQFQTIRFDLFDPEGRLVSQNRPQGPAGYPAGGFSEVEVHHAQAGQWKMLVFDTAFAGPDSYTGPLTYSISSQSFQTAGSVQPGSATIAPGDSATFQVKVTTPPAPGDTSESLVFGPSPSGDLARGTVPVTLRSLAEVGQQFTGSITGGNARMAFYGQELPYQFMVTGHHRDLDAQIHVANPGYQVLAFLVDPSGTPVDVQSSMRWDGGPNGQNISLFRQDPKPGIWSVLVTQINNVDSILTSSDFNATISYDQVDATAAGLPHHGSSARLSQGTTVNATITVKNTGNQQEGYMVDARRNGQTTLPLVSIGGAPDSEPLPINDFGTVPQFLLPPFSPAMAMEASSTVPITLDTSPNFGTPDVGAQQSGNNAIAVAQAAELPASAWSCAPSEQGPFSGTAPSTTFSCGAVGLTNPFAPDVATSAGNLWADVEQGSSTYDPLVLNAGQTGTISVQITAGDNPGTKVNGFLTVESFNFNTLSSDEMASFPYSYRVSRTHKGH